MLVNRLLFLLLLTSSAIAAEVPLPDAKPIPRMQAVPLPHDQTSFQLDGKELTAIHYSPQDFRVFWHPILTSKGVSLTRMGHPHDPLTHRHHNSVWISHANVNDVDFWGEYVPEKRGRTVCMGIPREGYTDANDAASMVMTNHWIKESDKSVQLIEHRRTEVRPLNGAASWLMLVDLHFSAPKDKPAKINPSFFGMIAVRMAKSIGVHDGGGRILNSNGQVNEAEVFRKPAHWVDYSGRITNDDDGFAGITLMNHPSNPHNPTPFHVRDDGWMGACLVPDVQRATPKADSEVIAPAAPTIIVTDAHPLRLRYALWVHDGIMDRAKIQEHYDAFSALPLPEMPEK